MGTPCYCSFTPPWCRWSYPNNTSKRCAPVEEMHWSFCSQEVPSRWSPVPGPGQTSPLHQAVGGAVSVCQLKYSFSWTTGPHQNLAHLYMTCIPESLEEALQINLAVYKQISQVHNDWAKQLVIPHCSEFHRSPNKPKTHKCWDPNTVLWQPHSNTE